jgi:DNA replicative helicase MCM subunit Mcm2 (Cdc46/Mcm family)
MVIRSTFVCPDCGEKHEVTYGDDEDMPITCTKLDPNAATPPVPCPDIWDLTVRKSERYKFFVP